MKVIHVVGKGFPEYLLYLRNEKPICPSLHNGKKAKSVCTRSRNHIQTA